MTPLKANPRLDAATVLVGWTNRSATRSTDKVFSSGEVVKLNTKLDAAARFSLLVSHPGHSAAVTVVLLLFSAIALQVQVLVRFRIPRVPLLCGYLRRFHSDRICTPQRMRWSFFCLATR